MRADRIEIPQGNSPDARICRHTIAQEVLAHLLRVPVSRGSRLAGRILRYRQLLRFAVNRCGRREEDVAALLARHLQHVEERTEVVGVVLERVGNRFTDGFECSKVDNCIYIIVNKQLAYCRNVAEIHLDKRKLATCDLADAVVVGSVAIGKVICDYDIIAALDKFNSNVAADKAGTAGNKHGLFHIMYGLIQVKINKQM